MTDTPSHAANGMRTPLYRDDWHYIEPVPLEEFRAGDFALMDEQRAVYYGEEQARHVLTMLAASENEPSFGYQINNFRHCLQSATMAHRAGKSEDYVAVALLHDIGFIACPTVHGRFAAMLLAPYVEPEIVWMLEHHQVFQDFHCHHHPTLDPDARERWRGHPAFATTAEFVAMFDQGAMDPDYENLPLEFFEPMVRRLFSRAPRSIPLG